jgi:hypothetical protein
MMIDDAFKWRVAAEYVVEDRGRAKRGAAGTIAGGGRATDRCLVAKGGILSKNPFRIRGKVSQEFLRLVASRSDEGAIQFASKYGMLTQGSESGDSESLATWWDLAKRLRKAQSGKGVTARIGLQELRRTRRGVIALVPRTLQSGLEAEVFLMGLEAELKECPGCGGWFEVGGKLGKNAHAEFCSDRCRYGHHNRVKANFIAGLREDGYTRAEAEKVWRRTGQR